MCYILQPDWSYLLLVTYKIIYTNKAAYRKHHFTTFYQKEYGKLGVHGIQQVSHKTEPSRYFDWGRHYSVCPKCYNLNPWF